MKIAIASLESVSPYSQSRAFITKKDRNETHEDFEKRIWKERCHTDENGQLYIPPMAFKNSLSDAAKYKSMPIPGKGKSTYTKHIEAGVACMEPVPLGIQVEDVEGEWLHVPSDGRRGGGSRVWKCFPLIRKWSGQVQYLVLDDLVTPEIFETHLVDTGQFIGIGRFRPRNNGFYGRFKVTGVDWTTR